MAKLILRKKVKVKGSSPDGNRQDMPQDTGATLAYSVSAQGAYELCLHSTVMARFCPYIIILLTFQMTGRILHVCFHCYILDVACQKGSAAFTPCIQMNFCISIRALE